jgi:hypothetical protein
MIRADEATWRSGYATVCKTVYTSSILVVASNSIPLILIIYLHWMGSGRKSEVRALGGLVVHGYDVYRG